MTHPRHLTYQISADVFKDLMVSGIISEREVDTLRVLYSMYPTAVTAQEVRQILESWGEMVSLNSISPRFAPLGDKGLITFVEKRKCSVTEKTAGAYRYSPGPVSCGALRPRTHKQKLVDILREITKDWSCCCKPGFERCIYCRARDAIDNK